MVIQLKQRSTLDEFEAFIHLPENSDKRFEFINGEIIEVPSNPFASEVANLISFFIRLFLRQTNRQGHITGADGGFMVGGNRYAPDVAYISYDRQPKLAEKGYNPNPPELAVEVISAPDNIEEQRTLRLKLTSYLRAGVIVWVVNPFDKQVEVYEVGKDAVVLDEKGVLTCDLLPGFELPVKDIFPKDSE